MAAITHQVRSTKPNGPNFDIISYNSETKRGTLRGTYGQFETDLSTEKLKSMGYKIVPVTTPI